MRPIGASSGRLSVAGRVALAGLDRQLHRDLGAVVERADQMVGIQDLDVVRRSRSCSARTSPGPLALEPHALRPFAMHAQRDALDVEDDVGDVLEHAGDRGEFVQHALDLHRGHRRALQRRQQHAAQRVAERQAEAALQRLGDDGGDALRIVAGLDRELFRLDQRLPVLLDLRHESDLLSSDPAEAAEASARERRESAADAAERKASRLRRGAAWAAGSRYAGSASRRGST